MKKLFRKTARNYSLFLLLAFLSLSRVQVSAQTILAQGEIAFVGYITADDGVDGTTQDDEFSFILLKDITAGTVIQFTDFGWLTGGPFQTANPCGPNTGSINDGIISWTATSPMSCGTQIRIRCKYSLQASAGTVTGIQACNNDPAAYLSLAIGGDQIFAYQGAHATPTLLAGISINKTWDAALTSCFFSSNSSTLPAALGPTANTTFIISGINAKYNCALSQDFPQNLITAINDNMNWNTDNTFAPPIPVAFQLPLNCTFGCATPVILTCPVNTPVAACQTQTAVNAQFAAWLATASGSGGCNGVLTNNNTGAPSACGGSTTVTFTYTSSCAPTTTTCTATFTVTAPPPVILTCPVNTTVAACQTQTAVNAQFAAWLATASGSGGCNGVLTNNNTGAPSACGGSTTVTFTYTSSCAPTTTTCTATFTVTAPPPVTLTCPAPVTVSCVSNVPTPDIMLVTVNSGCGVTVTYVGDVISNQTCPNRYTITRTYRGTDQCGNTGECTQIITVDDQTPPTLTCPADITVCGPAGVPAPNTALVTGLSDNCGGPVVVTHQGDAGTPNPIAPYNITRTYRATDACGNFTDCVQTITVNPVPQVNAVSNQTHCNGATVPSIVFGSNVAGATFSWSRTAEPIGLGVNSGSGSVPSFTATNAGSTPITATFSVVASYTNNGVTCTGTPIQFTLTVMPTPTVDPIPNQTVCH
ncbi:MAG: hypothetical protein ACO25B_11525, partial [Chitinophagaceae bacterium]